MEFDEIAEHDGDRAALRAVAGKLRQRLRRLRDAKRGDRIKQAAAVSDRTDADLFEIIGRQARQHDAVDRVFAESRLVLCETEAIQPRANVHC